MLAFFLLSSGVNLLRTAVPLSAQATLIVGSLSPKQDSSPKRFNVVVVVVVVGGGGGIVVDAVVVIVVVVVAWTIKTKKISSTYFVYSNKLVAVRAYILLNCLLLYTKYNTVAHCPCVGGWVHGRVGGWIFS